MHESCCAPSKGAIASLCEFKRELKQFERCVPIQQPCGENTQFETIFITSGPITTNALMVITNTSDASCDMSVRINMVDLTETIHSGDSLTLSVSGLSLVQTRCVGTATDMCKGIFKAHFFHSVLI